MPPPAATGPASATLAKAALRRLAAERAEPTPENYARAYALEQGALPEAAPSPAAADPAASRPVDSGEAWAGLIDRLVRGLERGGRQWTSARKKESLQRVLGGSRADARKLLQRLDQLVGSWTSDAGGTELAAATTAADAADPTDVATEIAALGIDAAAVADRADSTTADARPVTDEPWPASRTPDPPTLPEALRRNDAALVFDIATALADTVQAALEPAEPGGVDLGGAIAGAVRPMPVDAAAVETLRELCRQARLAIGHRHDAFVAMGALCHELTASLCDLAEDDSWARGQCAAMQTRLDEGLTARGVRSVGDLLSDTRARQATLRAHRAEARDALKDVVNLLLAELVELGAQTGRFHDSVGHHAGVIERADSVEGLTVAVRALVDESREVQAVVGASRQRLQDEHSRAQGLAVRVETLEAELRRLSDEVVTDQLTQIANRRGLGQAFEALTDRRAAPESTEAPLCIGLLDIDNFKRLNDQLGHNVGDTALRALADTVAKTLRPADVVARYGGEEFVVLLPATQREEGQAILTRLQRSLSGGLFLHDGNRVLVTFSAGVTLHRAGEPIEAALERADIALYEAKRTGKNRTCCA